MQNEKGKQKKDVSRRDFLAGSGKVVIGGVIGAGMLPGRVSADALEPNTPDKNPENSQSGDVVLDAMGDAPEWPYPIKYGEEADVVADVLILGGGVAGCHAAINAAKRGAKVVLVDKGAVVRSGCSGAGVDKAGKMASPTLSPIPKHFCTHHSGV